ncbi:MAG TPA: hypothetical protein VFQ79_03445 [Bryobacteraceae bacterium]|nr:hypothetical protein [Bryobacteraceae bacterium]
MGFTRVFGSCLAVVFLASTGSAADTTPQREIYIPVEFTSLNSPDYWSNGFWVGYKRSWTPGHVPEIRTFDRNGKEVIARKPLSLPDAYHTAVHAIAADRDGEVVVSAEFWRSQGDMAPVLCRMNRAGEVTLMARTESFLGRALAVSPDGGIWSLGSRIAQPFEPKKDYEVLERYDASGNLKSRALPRSVFAVKYDPAVIHDLGEPQVVASSTRAGVMSPGTKVWAELNASGEVIDRFTIEPPVSNDGALAELGRLVMSQDNEVYAFFAVVRRAGSTQPHFYGLYRLNRSAHRWDRVNTTPGPNFGGLYGIDRDSLIRRMGCCTYGWFPLSPVESASLGR